MHNEWQAGYRSYHSDTSMAEHYPTSDTATVAELEPGDGTPSINLNSPLPHGAPAGLTPLRSRIAPSGRDAIWLGDSWRQEGNRVQAI
jgi:hypothetical protein